MEESKFVLRGYKQKWSVFHRDVTQFYTSGKGEIFIFVYLIINDWY